MGFVIMGYGEECLKEYYLPGINNSNYSVVLKKELYKIRENIELRLVL